ncbi:MAG: hypothetical protein P9L92_00655 [Candidatus Electryonea clarkiae]|nr:hypothetical protein [Candidatus Electryonea clarkiae]MDP8287088.1 hypothetical protein [Candidatus Electryonea clarkiae]
MKSRKITMMVFAVFMFAPIIFASDLEISGYYENTLQGDYTDDNSEAILDASKLRLDFSSGGGKNELQFKGNINFIANHGPVSRDISPFLPATVTDSLDSMGLPVMISFPGERIFLDNAYLTWRHGSSRIRVGRQQLSWGTGYIFNPTDLFHSKNILDPTYEKEGVTAIRGDYYWGVGGQLSLITTTDDSFEDAGYALRAGTHLSSIGYDIAVTLHQITDSTAIEIASMETDSGTIDYPQVLHQQRRAIGFEASGEFFGPGVWFEGNYNKMETEDDFIRAVAGIDYTLDNGTYLMLEGLYNGRGKWEDPYPVTGWLENIMFGEPISQLMLFSGIRHDLTDLLMGSLYVIGGSDGAVVLNPRLDYSLAQNADLIVFGGVTFGKEESQFPPGLYSLIARATVYF